MNKLQKITYSNNIDYSSCQISNIIYEPQNEITEKSEIIKQPNLYELFIRRFFSSISNKKFRYFLNLTKRNTIL